MNKYKCLYNRYLYTNDLSYVFIDDIHCKTYTISRLYILEPEYSNNSDEISFIVEGSSIKELYSIKSRLPEYVHYCFDTNTNPFNNPYYPCVELVFRDLFVYYNNFNGKMIIFENQSTTYDNSNIIIDMYVKDNKRSGYIYILDSKTNKGKYCIWTGNDYKYFDDIKTFEDNSIILGLY